MRDSHRADAERLLARAVEEEVRRSGGRTDGTVLLSRSRGALDAMAQTAAEEYEAYTRALDEAEGDRLTFGQRYAKEGSGTPLLVAAVAAVAAAVADLAFGTDTGTAVGVGVTVGVVGAAATVIKVAGSHLPAAHHRAGAASQPGGPEQLRLQWLTALEVRGIRPFLDQQRVLSASTGPKATGPQLKGADKSAAARGRTLLEQSYAQLPESSGVFAGRRQELAKIRQWVQAGRASTRKARHGTADTRPAPPTVGMPHAHRELKARVGQIDEDEPAALSSTRRKKKCTLRLRQKAALHVHPRRLARVVARRRQWAVCKCSGAPQRLARRHVAAIPAYRGALTSAFAAL